MERVLIFPLYYMKETLDYPLLSILRVLRVPGLVSYHSRIVDDQIKVYLMLYNLTIPPTKTRTTIGSPLDVLSSVKDDSYSVALFKNVIHRWCTLKRHSNPAVGELIALSTVMWDDESGPSTQLCTILSESDIFQKSTLS
ncbi:hypothetical protein RF11_13921 [Thelohanellus kitauei]|uniref:Uncharacterized protein n=1 Tax=Thelohanellus kitauei TaxID=669202 RepID=A0A0C2I6X2_THEKT|nr:hypothetical protein RF11_13921 [Thelohanellus kitauei]